jgi:hypothetical protein
MTIANALIVMGVICLPVAVIGIWYAYARAQIFRLQRYDYWTTHFYAAAKLLVEHDETPLSLISLIDDLNEMISDPKTAIGIRDVFRKRLTSEKNNAVKGQKSKEDTELLVFLKNNPELKNAADTVMLAGLMAATYASRFGDPARSILADVFTEQRTKPFESDTTQDVHAIQARVLRGGSLVPLIHMR